MIFVLVCVVNISHFHDPSHGGILRGAIHYFRVSEFTSLSYTHSTRCMSSFDELNDSLLVKLQARNWMLNQYMYYELILSTFFHPNELLSYHVACYNPIKVC